MNASVRRAAIRLFSGARTARPVGFLIPPRSHARQYSSAPTVVALSFWKSLIPKPFRKGSDRPADWAAARNRPKSKEWNPATFFIVIFLFIGSMSIQMIATKRDYHTFSRRAHARIGELEDVIGKLQRGEDVDVEKALGVGDPQREIEWEEFLKEAETADAYGRSTPRKAETSSPPASSTNTQSTTAVTDSASQKSTADQSKKDGLSSFF